MVGFIAYLVDFWRIFAELASCYITAQFIFPAPKLPKPKPR